MYEGQDQVLVVVGADFPVAVQLKLGVLYHDLIIQMEDYTLDHVGGGANISFFRNLLSYIPSEHVQLEYVVGGVLWGVLL